MRSAFFIRTCPLFRSGYVREDQSDGFVTSCLATRTKKTVIARNMNNVRPRTLVTGDNLSVLRGWEQAARI